MVDGFAASLGSLLSGDLFITQMGVLGATAFFFLSSLVLSVLSFRSAAASHSALREAKDLASEMRHLTAQVELSARPRAASSDQDEARDYASVDRHEASIDLTDDDRADGRAVQHLEAAKKAAIEPSALLRGRLRRR